MKLFLASAMFLMTFTSQAARVQFDFDVLSSGASIYACNAGLKHKPHIGKICYNPDTFRSCDPGDRPGHGGGGHPLIAGLTEGQAEGGQCNPDTGEGCDCVCTGDMNGKSEHVLDIMRVNYTLWRDHGDPTYGIDFDKELQAGEYGYEELEDNLLTLDTKFAVRMKELSFNLGSERYGAQFFVDICYRATQIDYLTGTQEDKLNIDMDEAATRTAGQESINNPKYKFERRLTATDLAGTPTVDLDWDLDNGPIVWAKDSYQSLADLEVRTVIKCKEKNGDTFYEGSFSYVSFANQSLNFQNEYEYADLRGCVVRYEFREGARDAHKKVDQVRRWKMHGANICTDTAITNIED